ncbi:beta-ketoacyl reductase [Streptomyces sp. M19]
MSLAWGLWAEESGLTAALGTTGQTRLNRSGIAALATEEALALFDAALGDGRDLLVPVRLDLAALRGRTEQDPPHPLLRALVRPLTRPVPTDGLPTGGAPADGPRTRPPRPAPAATLAERLAALPDDERHQLVLGIVSAEIAGVLGHSTADRVTPNAP